MSRKLFEREGFAAFLSVVFVVVVSGCNSLSIQECPDIQDKELYRNSSEEVYSDTIDSGLGKDLRYFERNFRQGKPSNRQVQMYAVWPDAKEMLLSFKIDDSVGMFLTPRDSSFDKESYIQIGEGSWIRVRGRFTSRQQLDTSYKDVRELASTLVWSGVDLTGSIRKANARDIMFDGGYVVISSNRCGKMNVSKFWITDWDDQRYDSTSTVISKLLDPIRQ